MHFVFCFSQLLEKNVYSEIFIFDEYLSAVDPIISQKIQYHKQVCIYAFNKNQLKKFHFKKGKSIIEKIEDIEILRFFDVDEKIKMVKLNSNSVAVDEIRDVKKAEKLLKKKD